MQILMYCGNGYAFEEVFLPLILKKLKTWSISLILGDYFIPTHLKGKLDYLKQKSFIKNYEIFPIQNGISIKFYKKILDFINVDLSKYELILLGSDFMPVDLYFINHPKRSDNCSILVVSSDRLWPYIQKYLNQKGMINDRSFHYQKNNKTIQTSAEKLKDNFSKLKKYGLIKSSNIIFKIFFRKIRRIIIIIKKLYHYYLMPLLIIRRFFYRSHYDQYSTYTDRADGFIVFDELTKNAVVNTIKKKDRIFVANHPLSGFKNPFRIKFSDNSVRLLVCFAQNLFDELDSKKIERWLEIIQKISVFSGANEIHLRCHPRTSKAVKWPRKLLNRLTELNYKCTLVDSMGISLSDTIDNYCGVIGSPSGSLVSARAANPNIFVISIPDFASKSLDDQHWIMGSANGINVISEKEKIDMKHLKRPTDNLEKFLPLTEIIISAHQKINS